MPVRRKIILVKPMYGIEGRYTADQPQTFGRIVLANLMEEAGFATVEFLAPFPDYKLPVSILTEEGLSSKKFDGAALAWQSVRRDPQLPPNTNFSLELTWPEVFKNRLALDMANSFLIVASPLQQKIVKPGVLGYHYSTDRAPQYCKEIVFQHFDENGTVVNYRMLSDNHCSDQADRVIKFICPDKAVYAEGVLLSSEFTKLLTSDGWSMDEVGALIQRYVKSLGIIADQKGYPNARPVPDKLPGDFFDIIPQNIIISQNGEPVAIDTEWALNDDIELGWLLFRSLLLVMGSVVCFGRNQAGQKFLRRDFAKLALDAAGFSFTDDDFRRFMELEANVQQEVTGRPSHEFVNWQPEQLLPIYALLNRDEEIGTLQDEIDVARAEIDMMRDEIDVLYRSTSWKLTAPVRTTRRFIARLADRLRPLGASYTTVQPSDRMLSGKNVICSANSAATHCARHR